MAVATLVKKKKKSVSVPAAKVTMTLSEALASTDLPLYVLNSSGTVSADNRRTEVLVDIDLPHGTELLVVRDSWLPFDVTSQVPRQHALASPRFRMAVNKGLLEIITVAEAERILSSPDVTDERRRLVLRQDEIVQTADTVDEAESLRDISPQVVEVMNRSLAPRDRLAALKNMRATLTTKDIHYIVTKAASTETKLLAWIHSLA